MLVFYFINRSAKAVAVVRYGADGTLLQRVSEEPLRSLAAMSAVVVTRPMSKTVDSHVGALTFRDRKLLRVDTPAGYVTDSGMHYYIRDHQGNVRQVTDADGRVEQDSHYYPYGMLTGESGDILSTARKGRNPFLPSEANPYLYGGKEYLTTAAANLLDFTARAYDPATLLFLTPDPLRDRYLPVNPYLYCGADPINRIDPTGMKVEYAGNEEDIAKLKQLIGEERKDGLYNRVYMELEKSRETFIFKFGEINPTDANEQHLGAFNKYDNTITLSRKLNGSQGHFVIAEESYHAYQTIVKELLDVNIEYEAQTFAQIHTINLGKEYLPERLIDLNTNIEDCLNSVVTKENGKTTFKSSFTYRQSFPKSYKAGFVGFLNCVKDNSSKYYTNPSDIVPYRLLDILKTAVWLPKYSLPNR